MEHKKRGCVISPDNGSKVGLKAQKLLAQGIALGNVDKKQSRPERAKAFNIKAFALSGRLFCICSKTQGDALGNPGRCPGLGAFGLSARFNRTVRYFLASMISSARFSALLI